MKRKYSLLNVFRGTRIDFEAKDRKEAAAMGTVLLFDGKKFDAAEITMKNKEKAIQLIGKDKESNEEMTILVVETRIVENTEELHAFKKVN